MDISISEPDRFTINGGLLAPPTIGLEVQDEKY